MRTDEQDLVIRLVMPPLRERPTDVPLLTDAILRRLSMTRGKVVESVSREAMQRLMRYGFPGNVRELGIHKTTLHRKIRHLGIDLPPVDGRSARGKGRG